jgi:hypothetical protein
MALTQAQQNAINRVRGSSVDEEEENNSGGLTQQQRDAIERVRSGANTTQPVTNADAPTGFLDSSGNAIARGVSGGLMNMSNVSMAEDYSTLANYEEDRARRDAAGELPLWERILTYERSRGKPSNSPETLRRLAAESATDAQRRYNAAQANYPMSDAGREGLERIVQSESFGEGLMNVVKNPLQSASGLAQVALEQAPTIAVATALRNPTAGIATFGLSAFSQERYGQLIPEAAEAGYDLLSPEGAAAAVADTEFMKRQAQRGMTRGTIIAGIDMLTAGLASKTPLNKVGLAKNTGVQIVGGGTGEAAAEYVDTGTINPGEVLVEALAEGVTAPLDVAAFAVRGPNNSQTELDAEQAFLDSTKEQNLKDADAQNKAEIAEDEARVGEETADVVNDIREIAAQSFTPFAKFVKDKAANVDAQNQLDIQNPDTEINAAFKAHLKEYRANATPADRAASYDAAGVKKIKTKFLNGVKKGASNPEADALAYEQALDEYAKNLNANPPPVDTAPVDNETTTAELMETMPVRSRANAVAKAEAVLGKDWVESGTYPDLEQTINGEKFKVKTFNEALEQATQPVAEPVNASTEEAAQALSSPKTLKLSEAQDRIFAVLNDHFLGDKQYAVDEVHAGGQFLTNKIAEMAGVKNKEHVSTSIARFQTKFLESQGLLTAKASKADKAAAVTEFKDRLSTEEQTRRSNVVKASQKVATEEDAVEVNAAPTLDTAEQNEDGSFTETVDRDPNSNLGDALDDGEGSSSIFSEIGIDRTVGSVGQGNYDNVAPEDRAFTEARSQEPDAYENIRQQTADRTRRNDNQQMLQDHLPDAVKSWRDGVSDGGPKIDQLSAADVLEWVSVVQEYKEGIISDAQLAIDLREIETRYDADNAGVTMENTDETASQDAADQAEADNDARQDTGLGESAESGTQTEQIGNANTTTVGPNKPTVVERKPKKKLIKPKKFSRKRIKTDGVPTTVEKLQVLADGLFEDFVSTNDQNSAELTVEPGGIYSPLQLHKTAKAAFRALGGSVALEELKKAQGVIDPRDNSRAHLIAENIEEGSEAAVIAHEVGVHLGLENEFLDNAEIKALADEVNQWSKLDESAVEKQIHNAVVGRLAFARIHGMDEAAVPVETIAYAVEEAVALGVTARVDQLDRAAGWLEKTRRLFTTLANRWFNDKNPDPFFGLPRGSDQAIFQASELVALVSGAATGAMGNAAVEQGAVSKNKMDVMAYYANTPKAKVVADINDKRAVLFETNDQGEANQGAEFFMWGDGSKFGTKTNIATEATFDFPGDMEMLVFGDVTTEEGSASPILTVVLDRAEYTNAPGEFVPNVYLLTIIGPEGKVVEDIGIPEDFDITKTKDIDGKDWVRLEGVRHRDVVRVLTEARRRMTRYNNGRVPNIMYNRVTGAAAANTDTGRVGSKTDKELFKRFSFKEQTPIPAVKKKANREIARSVGGDGAVDVYDNFTELGRQAASSLKFVHNIVRDARKDMPSVGKWWDGMIAADVTRNEIKQSFDGIRTRARALKVKRLEAVNKFLGESTVDQKWGYDPVEYNPELFTNRAEGSGSKVDIDPVKRSQFKSLAKEEQQIVVDIFAHGEKMRQRKVALMKKLGVSAKFFNDSSLVGPYAPLKRFGYNVVELKSARYVAAERSATADEATKAQKKLFEKLRSSGDHYVVRFFDTEGAAQAFNDANIKNFAYGSVTKRAPNLDEDRVSNPEVYEKVMAALAASEDSAMDGASKTAFRQMVLDMYFQSMDERSARTSGARRLNIAGYDPNMMRSFLANASAEAGLISQMENGTEINTALAEARKEVTVGEVKDKERQRVFATISGHYQRILKKSDTPIQDRIATANSVYMLLTSAGYHLTNATQPSMVTVPRIAGDFGNYTGTWSALFRGYKVALASSKIGLNLETEINFDKVPTKYHALLKSLQDRQILDQGMEEDGAFDRFNTGWEGLNKASDVIGTTTRKLYNIAKFVESQNRISSAIAAYDMALSNPTANPSKTLKNSPEGRAEQYAIDVVEDTQGNFSELDAPLLIKSLPKLAVQYRKYQLLMAWHYASAFKQIRWGSPEEKAAGKRVLGYSVAHAALGAGAIGVPGASLAFWLATFLGDDDEPQDLERYIKDYVDNELLGEVLSKGAFNLIGIDLTTKLSQDKIMSPLPYVDLTPGAAGASDLVMGFAGPFGTTATNFFRAWEYFAQGDTLKGIEYSVPKGIRTAVESYRLGTEGLTTKSGVTLVKPTEFDIKSLLVNAMGLPSSEIAKVKWTRGQQFELEQYFSKETSKIRNQYIKANKARDRDRQRELREEFKELQRAKDRVRPFFNNVPSVLKRQSVVDLMKAPLNRMKLEMKEQRKLR